MSDHLSADDLDHQQTDLILSDDDGRVVSVNQDEDDDNDNDATGRTIDPTTSTKKRIIRNPQPKLNAERLCGPKGVQTIEEYFQGFKWQGKNHEVSDLNKIMKRIEHWGHRLYPKYNFDDFLDKVATLGTKKEVQTFLTKYRNDMLTENLINTEENVINDDDDDGDGGDERLPPLPFDNFDLLLAEQVDKTRQPETTINKENYTQHNVSSTVAPVQLDEETKKRIEKNRQLALEKKMARLKAIEEEKATAKSKAAELSQQEQQLTPDFAARQNLDDIYENELVEKENNEMTTVAEESQVSSSSTSIVQQTENNCSNETSSRKELDSSTSVVVVDDDDAAAAALDIPQGHLTSSLLSNSIDDSGNNPSTTMNKTTGKRALTNEELDREIDEAVFNFINRKRQSK